MISWGNLFLHNAMIFIVIFSKQYQTNISTYIAPNNTGGGGVGVDGIRVDCGDDVDNDLADHLSVFSDDHAQHP